MWRKLLKVVDPDGAQERAGRKDKKTLASISSSLCKSSNSNKSLSCPGVRTVEYDGGGVIVFDAGGLVGEGFDGHLVSLSVMASGMKCGMSRLAIVQWSSSLTP
jgi:hypothetical protein